MNSRLGGENCSASTMTVRGNQGREQRGRIITAELWRYPIDAFGLMFLAI
jgi:hypothetical protein